MIVRGAGAIGSTAAYALALAARQAPDGQFSAYMTTAYATIEDTRPTAQNLFAGLNWVAAAIDAAKKPIEKKPAGAGAAGAPPPSG